MEYHGSIEQNLYSGSRGVRYINISHALQAKLIYALPDVDLLKGYNPELTNLPLQKLLVFDYESLQYITAIGLPKFDVQNRSIDGQGYYLFINSQGDHYYLLYGHGSRQRLRIA